METSSCELCGREGVAATVHHLAPRSQARRVGIKTAELPTALLCAACHRQLHALFSNRELADDIASVEALRAHPAMRKFLKWVRKQAPGKRVKVRRPKTRRARKG